MRIISKTLIFKISLLTLFFVVPFLASAQLPNVPGPGGTTINPNDINTIPGLISYIYNLAFWIVGIAVFFQVFRAGFIIFFGAAGSASKVAEGKKMITNAIVGLILLFASWMILNIINPDLVKNTFDFGSLLQGSNTNNGGDNNTASSSNPGGGQKKYSCNSNNACVADSNGSYTTSNCDNKCTNNQPPTGDIKGDWQITWYTIFDENQPGQSKIASTYGFNSSTGGCSANGFESNSNCGFLYATCIQGTGKLRDGRFLHYVSRPKGSSCKSTGSIRWQVVPNIQGSYGDLTNSNGAVVATNVVGKGQQLSVPALAKGGIGTQVTVEDTGAVSAFGYCTGDVKKHIDWFYWPDGPAEKLYTKMGLNTVARYNVQGASVCKGKVRCDNGGTPKYCTY